MANENVTALLIRGDIASGKTTLLAKRARELAATGEEALVVATCPGGLRQMRAQLADLPVGAHVRCVAATQLASELLTLPEVRERLGYAARLTMPAEDAMLFEDMKTSGIKQRRLREMMGFFERTYSDLGEQADDFPYEWEETGMLNYQQDYLRAYGVTTLDRAACTAARCLEADEALAARVGYAHVLVDDYELLGRAMQRVCCMLATTSVAVACGSAPATPVNFRFPNENGADEFLKLFENTQVTRLEESHVSSGVCAALNALRTDAGMALDALACAKDAAEGTGERVAFATPAAEFAGIADILQDAHRAGVAWGNMAVSSASELWLANAAANLRRVGIPLAFAPGANPLPVGFKSEKRNDAARLTSMLALAADPDDGMALRTWCGFGSYTANSACFMRIHRVALDETCSIRRVIEGMRAGGYPDIAKLGDAANVMRALDEAEFALEHLKDLRGNELLQAAAQLSQVNDGAPAASVVRLLACSNAAHGLQGDEGAAEVLALVNAALLAPTPSAEDGVRVCSPEALAGERFNVVVFCGAVNGIMPMAKFFDPAQMEDDKRDRMRRKDDARLHAAFSRANGALHVTSFQDIGLEQAERLGLEADRIRAEGDARIATVSPSVLTCGIGLRSE